MMANISRTCHLEHLLPGVAQLVQSTKSDIGRGGRWFEPNHGYNNIERVLSVQDEVGTQ